jgi:hypothetical protein
LEKVYVSGKIKDFLVTCDESREGDRYAAPLLSNLGARERWVIKATSRQLYTRDNVPGPIVHEGVWASRPVWRDVEKKNSLDSTGIQTRTVYAVASYCTYYAIPFPK